MKVQELSPVEIPDSVRRATRSNGHALQTGKVGESPHQERRRSSTGLSLVKTEGWMTNFIRDLRESGQMDRCVTLADLQNGTCRAVMEEIQEENLQGMRLVFPQDIVHERGRRKVCCVDIRHDGTLGKPIRISIGGQVLTPGRHVVLMKDR